MPDFNKILEQAQEMQSRLEKIQDALGAMTVTANSGGGMVTVEINGQQQVLACRIEKSLFDSGDREMVEDLALSHTRMRQKLRTRRRSSERLRSIVDRINNFLRGSCDLGQRESPAMMDVR